MLLPRTIAATRNPLALAADTGSAVNGFAGRQILLALEVMFTLRAARQMTFADSGMRLRQNVLVEGPPGVGKSFVGDFFYTKCCNARGNFDKGGGIFDEKRPAVLNQSGAMTWERMRGSCNSRGIPSLPALLRADFVNMTEMSAVFGEDSKLDMKAVRLFGGIAEEGRLEVSLLKMDEMDEDDAKKWAEKTAHIPNYHFSIDPRGFTFTTGAPFSIATTELDEKTLKLFRSSGFLSRFDHVKISMSQADQMRFLREFGIVEKVDCKPLANVNADMWNTTFHPIPMPPKALLAQPQSWLVDQVAEVVRQNDCDPLEVANLRSIGNLVRLMAASAIARIFEGRKPGDCSPVKSIDYTRADADFAISYLTPHFNQMLIDDTLAAKSKLSWADVPLGAKDTIRTIAGATLAASGHLPRYVETSEFIATAGLPRGGAPGTPPLPGCAEQTARNWIAKLVKARVMTRGRLGKGTVELSRDYLTRELGLSDGVRLVAAEEPEHIEALDDGRVDRDDEEREIAYEET